MLTGNAWGAPGVAAVQVRPGLVEFLAKGAERDVAVGLSTWLRAGLDDAILYVGLSRLEWDWTTELCAYGVREAVDSGRWVAVSTSNCPEPQFESMWRDVGWHRRTTDTIARRSTDFDG